MKPAYIKIAAGLISALALTHCGGARQDELATAGTLSAQESQQVQQGHVYAGAQFFRDPDYAKRMDVSREKNPALAARIDAIKSRVGTAVWVDKTYHLFRVDEVLAETRRQQQASGQPVVATFVVYNLPDRDCSAGASAGELTLKDRGMERYKAEYIDQFAKKFAEYSDVRIAIVLEPDSLPNIVTNRGAGNCTPEVLQGYREGVVYAIQHLAMPHVAIYLDVAHSGWLGWEGNRTGIAQVFREVLDAAGGEQLIRGFATNISNYTPIVEPDPSEERRKSPYYGNNPAMDELTYVSLLSSSLGAVGITRKNFIIDTGRNGNPRARSNWGSWCNVANAKVGELPAVDPMPIIPIGSAHLDAYMWIKPPGESDGSCGGGDSMEGAPPAGMWFHEHFQSMIQ